MAQKGSSPRSIVDPYIEAGNFGFYCWPRRSLAKVSISNLDDLTVLLLEYFGQRQQERSSKDRQNEENLERGGESTNIDEKIALVLHQARRLLNKK